jgi:hypothetical protein
VAETFVVVVEKKVDGKVVSASPLQTIVADSAKAAEQVAIAKAAKADEFEDGMEASAVPFQSLSKQ